MPRHESEAISDDIADLAAAPALDPNAPPDTIGGFPLDDPNRPAPPRDDARDDAPLALPADDHANADAAPLRAADSPPQSLETLQAQLADLQTRMVEGQQRHERELEFMRRGGATPPAAAPAPGPPQATAEQIIADRFNHEKVLPFRVDARTAELLGLPDPERAAPVLDAVLRQVLVSNNQALVQGLWGLYQAYEQQNGGSATQLVQSELAKRDAAQEVRETFWRDHGDLAPYAELVRLVSSDLAQKYGHQLTPKDWMDVTQKTVRAHLASAGIDPRQTRQGAPGVGGLSPQRIRPAIGEGTSGRPNGRTNMTPVTSEIMALAGLRL